MTINMGVNGSEEANIDEVPDQKEIERDFSMKDPKQNSRFGIQPTLALEAGQMLR